MRAPHVEIRRVIVLAADPFEPLVPGHSRYVDRTPDRIRSETEALIPARHIDRIPREIDGVL